MQWLTSALLVLKWNILTIFRTFLKLTTINRPILKKSNFHEENTGRLNLGIGCRHMVQRAVSSLVLSNNTKGIICRSIMFAFALYQHATWSLTSVEEHTLRVSENRALRNVFGHKRQEVTGE